MFLGSFERLGRRNIKAKTLTRMAVSRAGKLNELEITEVPVIDAALIVGGGAAGMNAALNLADQGFPVHLIERKERLGGNLHNIHYFSSHEGSGSDLHPQTYLSEITKRVTSHPLITTYLNTNLLETEGFKGNFTSTLENAHELISIRHGIIIIATGGVEYRGRISVW